MPKELQISSKGFSAIFERLEKSEEYELDALKVELCEQIYLIMEQEDIAKAELARRLKTSRAYITKLLQGSANFTLESLVKVARALECSVSVSLRPKAEEEFSSVWKARSASDSLSESARQKWREFRLTDFIHGGGAAKAYVTTPSETSVPEPSSARILEFVKAA
jgi:transcriptional regulator with XRE-family HTH domain